MESVHAGLGHSPVWHGTLSHSANGGGWAALDHNSIGCLLASLHSARDLATMQLVCCELHALASHNSFWLPLLATEFGLELQVRRTVARAWSRDAQVLRMLQTAACMPRTAKINLLSRLHVSLRPVLSLQHCLPVADGTQYLCHGMRGRAWWRCALQS